MTTEEEEVEEVLAVALAGLASGTGGVETRRGLDGAATEGGEGASLLSNENDCIGARGSRGFTDDDEGKLTAAVGWH